MKKIAGIYLIRNKTTNKVYVGQSIDINRRWYQHIYYLDKGTHENQILQNAWNKYGKEDFEFTVLKICKNSYYELNQWEVFYMEQYQAMDRGKGYNIAMGGDNSGNTIAGFTEEKHKEFCKKISERKKEWDKTHESPFKGKHHSDESKQKISISHKGRKLGIKRPEQSKIMIGSNNSRALKVKCIDTGEIFGCAKEAAEKYGVTNSTILKTCKGIQKKSAGMRWEYV